MAEFSITHPVHGSDPYLLHMLAGERLCEARHPNTDLDHARALLEDALDLDQIAAFQFLDEPDSPAYGPLFVRAASIAVQIGEYGRALDLIVLGNRTACPSTLKQLEELNAKVLDHLL